MRRSRASDDAVEVEIVEVDDPAGLDHGAPADAPDAAALRDRARRRVLRWVGLGVIAALATAVVVVNVAEARQEAARRAALAQIPWLMPRIDGPLQEAWRAPGTALVAETSDLIVTQASDSGGALVAVDESSGEVAWEYPAQDAE